MLKNQKILFTLCSIFVLIELILGTIMYLPMGNKYVSYSIIVLACLFCFLFAEKTKSYVFTQIALIFTSCADFFLVCLDASNQLAGMIFFLGTQTSYFLRIYFEEKRTKIKKFHLIARICTSILVLVATCLVLGNNTDAVALITMLYFANLIINSIFAFVNFKTSPLMAIGLVFFIFCDIFVGLSSIEPYFTISEGTLLYNIINPGINMAWIFYVPSQILLALSPMKIKKRV